MNWVKKNMVNLITSSTCDTIAGATNGFVDAAENAPSHCCQQNEDGQNDDDDQSTGIHFEL